MAKTHIELGNQGEKLAVNFLKNKGYNIVSTNYRTKLGQIDIVAKDNKAVCFIEVKARSSQRFGQPIEAIQAYKQKKISQSALIFLKEKGLLNSQARFDVVSISYSDIEPEIKLIKNAFELDSRYLY